MRKLAVIGAGQLGSRHLQALMKLTFPCEIWVMDPSAASLDTARERASVIAQGADHKLYFTQQLTELPRALDYVIVATAADVRWKVLQQLLGASSVRYLLLEKVLFQDLAHYDAAQQLFASCGTSVWVNCTRRAYPIYDRVRDFFAGRPLWQMNVSGGEWGLGCNGVHFLDLYAFLGGETVNAFSTDALDPQVIASKRSGFHEFTGTLTGTSPSGRFEATSRGDSGEPIIIELRAEGRSCVLDEATGTAFFGDHAEKRWTTEDFTNPFLSDVGAQIAEGLLSRGECQLPTYAESAACHVPFVRALASFAARYIGQPANICPIT
ncbi:Gfo/Idh/MocA family oxidoreductase [Sphingomonas sp. R-74633]|uniref:Gfo/Idh/MocA family oxidoreductase n=1 Tax=Sphingomonas sp. R-74633 TaxID=2751188 RepID=UPI0015D1B166|nr:Gfo/Idh/MocA family oxidoreductase [Sphingomonas sp. R-74633]NYT39226.1 Gfo/Idh/MocA family oxidoreductase [Sphingomonas sp. R-74633]